MHRPHKGNWEIGGPPPIELPLMGHDLDSKLFGAIILRHIDFDVLSSKLILSGSIFIHQLIFDIFLIFEIEVLDHRELAKLAICWHGVMC